MFHGEKSLKTPPLSLKSPGILLKGLLLKVAILAKKNWKKLKNSKNIKKHWQSTDSKRIQKNKKIGKNGTNSTKKQTKSKIFKKQTKKLNEQIEKNATNNQNKNSNKNQKFSKKTNQEKSKK